MNYIVVYKENKATKGILITYRDESDILYKRSTLVKSIDDAIFYVRKYIKPDNDFFIIKETFLGSEAFNINKKEIINNLEKYLDEMETFDFGEALAFLKADMAVVGPNGRVYKMENNKIMCYPDIINRPKQKREEINFKIDSILYEGWYLFNE